MNKSDKYFKNGILMDTRQTLLRGLVNLLLKTNLTPKFPDEKLIDVYLECQELKDIDEKVRFY